MFIFFDTETTGKPKDYKARMQDLDNWPRVTQLAWIVYDASHKEVASHSFLIKPDGWVIPKEQFFIENNMSTERCEAEGLQMSRVIEVFAHEAKQCEYLVAHNIGFDYNVFGAEMLRYKMGVGKRLKQICTMDASTNYCQLPGNYGSFKWPKLTELHRKLFGADFEGAHNALDDVKATARCFFAMLDLKLINLNQ